MIALSERTFLYRYDEEVWEHHIFQIGTTRKMITSHIDYSSLLEIENNLIP